MGDELGTRGRRIWSVGWVLVFAGAGCATSGADTDASAAAVSSRAGERTQQVVQRMLPAEDRAAVAEDDTSASSSAEASAVENSPANNRGANSTAAASRSTRRADAISSKHLEAELNRLEAELGR